jgi:hypothetical protein
MATVYAPLKKIRITDLIDGRLEKFGVREDVDPTTKCRYLTDGNNYLSVGGDNKGFVRTFTRRGANAPGKILEAIAEAFDTDIVSEYEPQFWGFDTQEEWDAHWAAIAKDADNKFYLDVLNYVSNKPNTIKPGTIGEIQAKIAKQLIEADPTLVLSERREDLQKKVDEIYDRDHRVFVRLSEQDIALADMVATHEDDLPKA